MTISIHQGDLLSSSDTDAIVNTVNCVGVMGKGIALQFKKKWPENFRAYEKACKNNEISLGKMFIYDLGQLASPKFIINFPTKDHWRSSSKLVDIEAGLKDLLTIIKKYNIHSIAIPPLGCGNGGLDWSDVFPLITKTFEEYPELDIHIYPPNNKANPNLISQNTKTTRPKMTKGRAALLLIIENYREIGYGLSRIEVQKLAYFLQESGFDLNLNFIKYEYGPYTNQLRHVLNRIDGHFIQGVGDGMVESEIRPFDNALIEARNFINQNSLELVDYINKVQNLINGYESFYGLELLSTVHWVIKYENAHSLKDAIDHVHNWNERKKKIAPNHIKIALERLLKSNFITM